MAQERVKQLLKKANPHGLKNAVTDLRRLEESLACLKELCIEGAFSAEECDGKCAKLLTAHVRVKAQTQRAAPDLKRVERALEQWSH